MSLDILDTGDPADPAPPSDLSLGGAAANSVDVTYDVSDPENLQVVDYANNRDFSADLESEAAGDLGLEGLLFISVVESPSGAPGRWQRS